MIYETGGDRVYGDRTLCSRAMKSHVGTSRYAFASRTFLLGVHACLSHSPLCSPLRATNIDPSIFLAKVFSDSMQNTLRTLPIFQQVLRHSMQRDTTEYANQGKYWNAFFNKIVNNRNMRLRLECVFLKIFKS